MWFRLVTPFRPVTQARPVLCGLVQFGLVLAVFAVGVASAQQNINFTLLESYNGSSAIIQNDTPLTFSTTVGTKQTITINARYTGSTLATITQTAQAGLIGSTEFTVTSNLTPPETLSPGDSFTLQITFSPTNASAVAGVLTIPYTEPTGTEGAPVQNAIQFPLQGESPSFLLSYVLQTIGNQVVIQPGGTIPFGATQINTTALANLDVTNVGSGPGVITSITGPAAGSPFKLENIPLIPPSIGLTVPSDSDVPLIVQYAPTAVENDTAQITITYQGGATATVNLTGNGITSTFTYQYVVGGVSTTVASGGTITFLGANPGQTSSLIVKVTNTGSASGTISSVSTSGPFTLTNPVVTPATLTPGEVFNVPLTFTPTQVGPQTGQLAIGNAFFTLSGQGSGSNLTYSYASGGVSTTVNPNTPGAAVLFGSIPVGQSEKVTFTVTNSGTSPATISLIGTSSANNQFTVPALPAQTLAAGKMLSFPITFTPAVNGIANGTLLVNNVSVALVGNATAPTALPSYTISGPSGTVPPATQSNISLTLSSAYSLDIAGVLTLTTEGSFGTDPALQFETGSTTGNRTVDFTIPAGATSADFAGQGSQLLLQTGTVAETATLAATFATTGGANLTPSSPPTLQFTIPSEAPVLVTAQVTNTTSNSFDLAITGYSTIRSLSSLNVTFTAASGFNIQASIPAIDVGQGSTAWFSSPASEAYGGQFTITMPFLLQGTVPKGDTLIESIASVTATVSNSIGASGPLTAPVQ
jgi:hypothetical protein